jgi:hypothetical protein
MAVNKRSKAKDIKKWIAIRKKVGQKIDPKTAEVMFRWSQIFDPYGVNPNLPKACYQVGQVGFARSPGSDVWVCFYDLPNATVKALRERHS